LEQSIEKQMTQASGLKQAKQFPSGLEQLNPQFAMISVLIASS
jgi:hypothetical protein